MGEYNPTFSIEASYLHDSLMNSLALEHENQEHRKRFANVINYARMLFKRFPVKCVTYHNATWNFNFEGENENMITIDGFDLQNEDIFNEYASYYGIVFETQDGIECNYRYTTGGMLESGYVVKNAKMTEEMQNKIRSMGLVPAIKITGTYHITTAYGVGILPEFVNKVKNECEDDLYAKFIISFDCIYDENNNDNQ